MFIWTVILISIGTYIAYICHSLYRNYKICVAIGLPIIISPAATLNPFWIITYNLFPPILNLLPRLPFSLGQWAQHTYMGWQFADASTTRIHSKLGPAFTICTPSINEIHLADPAAVHSVLSARKNFIKPAIMYDGLNVFGRNVDTVEGEHWQRHRKITAPSFNERVSASVWNESIRQAQGALSYWVGSGSEGTRETVEDTATVTLHVFTFAGFGLQYPFRSSSSKSESKVDLPGAHKLSYRDALGLIISNFTLLVMLPMSVLKWPIWPTNIRDVGAACDEFKAYLRELVSQEQSRAKTDNTHAPQATNLLTTLISTNNSDSAPNSSLSDDELYGNLFIYSFAGHETTANTVATSIAYLALHPEWQDWLHDEIERISSSNPGSWEDHYETIFPHLTRCQAIMLETLRLHGSIVFIPKAATAPFQTITITRNNQTRTHTIPEGTFVNTNVQSLHCDVQTWGADALDWRPDRWVERSADGAERLVEMPPGTFVAWSEGPRSCPGKKFSQVEFAAVMAVLFSRHTVGPKVEGGEGLEGARRRLRCMIDDSTITAITLQMKRPRDVALVWEERS